MLRWLVTGGDQEKLDKVPDAVTELKFNEYYEPSDLQKRILPDVHGWWFCADWLGCILVPVARSETKKFVLHFR